MTTTAQATFMGFVESCSPLAGSICIGGVHLQLTGAAHCADINSIAPGDFAKVAAVCDAHHNWTGSLQVLLQNPQRTQAPVLAQDVVAASAPAAPVTPAPSRSSRTTMTATTASAPAARGAIASVQQPVGQRTTPAPAAPVSSRGDRFSGRASYRAGHATTNRTAAPARPAFNPSAADAKISY